MCKYCGHKADGSFLNGVLFGAIIGAVIGILYAPDKGGDTRKKLKKDVDEFMDKAGPVVKDAIEKSKPMLARTKQKINETLENIADEIDGLEK